MVSRIEFFCPGCGAPEVPVLVATPYYNCPNCETITPRDKLDRQRRNNYLLAGTGPLFGVTVLQSFSVDNTVAQDVVLSSPLPVAAANGDLLVAAVCSSGSSTPIVVKWGTDTMTAAIEATDILEGGFYTLSAFTNTSPQTITFDFTAGTACDEMCALIFKINGQASSSPIDQTKVTHGPSGTGVFTSGNTAALADFNELSVGLYMGTLSTNPTFSFAKTFQPIAPPVVSPVPNGTIMGVATRQLTSKAATSCTGTDVDAQNSCYLMTIKPR